MATTSTPVALLSAAPLSRAGAMRAALAIAILVAAAALPLALTPYQTGLATQVLIFGILAMSIDLLAGFAGRTSLAHGAIFGVAAYVVVYGIEQAGVSPPVAIALGIAAASALAAVFAVLAV